MNREQISKRVRDNLNDLGITFYSVDDMINSLQDGYDEVAVYCECIEKQVDIDFLPNTTYYDMFTLVPDYYRVVRLYNYNINHFIDVFDDREFLGYRYDWELANQNSMDAMILGPRYLGFNGRNVSVGKWKMWYKATAPKLALETDVPRINENYQLLLENYSTADLLEQNEEYVKASTYWEHYNVMLEEYRRKIQLWARADRIFQRSEVYW